MNIRSSGILLHPSSLPSGFGIGDLGPAAYRFVDFLSQTHQHFWQMLPINPTDPQHGHSPYHSISAFAGNPLLISPQLLLENDWLTRADLPPKPAFPPQSVDFAAVMKFKTRLLRRSYQRLSARKQMDAYTRFCKNAPWLNDYALFKALKHHYRNRPWPSWPQQIRDRRPKALRSAEKRLETAIHNEKFLQFLFFEQWKQLKAHCHRKGVHLIGDVPIYVPLNSADVWTHPQLFMLSAHKNPLAVSGVPPDYFSKTGQLWGHPVYRWDVMQIDGFAWWIDRMAHYLSMFDKVRIDHFRGFVAYWQVPFRAKTAVKGKWISAPAEDFFRCLSKRFSCLPLIAEDLGTITPDVRQVMDRFQFPGMRVLLFAFGDDFPHSVFLPHNYVKNCVAYTGTHDNNTVQGWYRAEAGPSQRRNFLKYLGRDVPSPELHWTLIRLVMMSVADTAMIPM